MSSRLRTRTRRCYGTVQPPSAPRAMLTCTGVDGAEAVVPWSRALAHPVAAPSLAPLLEPVTPWDLVAVERHVAGLLVVDELRRAARAWRRARALPAPRYMRRGGVVEPPPLRQVGVIGDLAAALAEIPDRESALVKSIRRAA